MDKRKGVMAGVKKLGPTGKFLFCLAIIGFVMGVIYFALPLYINLKSGTEAKNDREEKHYREMKEFEKINTKLDKKDRPYIRINNFNIRRDNSRAMSEDIITLNLEKQETSRQIMFSYFLKY